MINVLSGRHLWSLLLVSSLSWLSFFALPYEMASLVARFSISDANAGWIASAELLALAIAAIIFGRFIGDKDKRLLAVIGVALALIGAAVSVYTDSLSVIIGARLILGFGLGLITASTNAIPANYAAPEKTYAKMIAVMAIVYGVFLFVVPHATTVFGAKGFDIVELIVVAILGAASLFLPAARAIISGGSSSEIFVRRKVFSGGVVNLLIAIFALYASQAVGWTFAINAAQNLQLTDTEIGNTFTINALLQIPFALYVTWLGTRLGYFKPIAAGLIILIFCMLCQYLIASQWLFMICASLASAGACIAYPYMLGALAELDESGSSSAVAGAVLYLGAAVGPAFAGYAFTEGGLPGVGYLSAALLVVSLFSSYIAVVALVRIKRLADAV